MTDGNALLAAILAHPGEDTPRLAYADWLDEQGGEASAARAEFIRVQCVVARLATDQRQYECINSKRPAVRCRHPLCPANVWKREQDTAASREQELWSDCDRWFDPAPLPAMRLHPSTTRPEVFRVFEQTSGGPGFASLVQRGFVQTVLCPASDWFGSADRILARHPVTRVRLTTAWTAGVFQRRDGTHAHVHSLDGFRAFLKGEYPGIIFDLPTA